MSEPGPEIPQDPPPLKKKKGWPLGKPRKLARADRPKYEALPDDDEDRLKVPRELIPDGTDYQWVTDAVLGQPMPQRRARFERRGWQPVPAERHDGMFMPKGYKGEINVDGLVLMERPMEYTRAARKRDAMKAAEQVYVREAQMRGGDLSGVRFDTTHPSLQKVNRVNKQYEKIDIPPDDD